MPAMTAKNAEIANQLLGIRPYTPAGASLGIHPDAPPHGPAASSAVPGHARSRFRHLSAGERREYSHD
jgi:hypothetical protein